MPKLAPNKVPSYRRHKQSGQAIVTLGGRDFLLGPYGSAASKAEYSRVTAEWLANGRRLPDAGAGMTVSTLIAEFRKHAQTYYRDADGRQSGEVENFKHALRPVRRLYGATPASDFGPLALQAVRQSMIDAGSCRQYVNRQTGRVRQVFKWAASRELVPASVYHGLAAVDGLRRGRSEARESDPVRPVAEAHVAAVKNHVSRQVWAMIELQTLTGMRPGEVVVMRTLDVDTTGKLWTYRPVTHKTQHHGHDRVVYFGPKAQAVVGPFLRPILGEYLFSPAEAEAERREKLHAARKTPSCCGNTVGSNRAKNPKKAPAFRYTVRSYYRAIRDSCDGAFPPPPELARQRVRAPGRKATRREAPAEWKARLGPTKWAELCQWQESHRWHPHQLRHNAGTRLRKEYGLEAAQVVLGHRSLAVTEIYAEKNIAAAQRIMAEVG
jgi:integrase